MARIMTLLATATLAACAVPTPAKPSAHLPVSAGETISISVGPCFGFCPVYDVVLRSDGTLRFVGHRHTAVLGEKTRHTGISTYDKLRNDLAAFRPVDGSEGVVECSAAVSDTAAYSVIWTDSAGRKTVAATQSGCPGGPGQALGKLLGNLPVRLGIAAWAKQTTRRGSSRG